MADVGEVRMPISDVVGRLTMRVRITGMVRFNLRMRLAIWLMSVAAFVAPVRMVIETWNEGVTDGD